MILVRSIRPPAQRARPSAAEPRVTRNDPQYNVRELEIDYDGRTYTLRFVPRGKPPLNA